LELRELDTASDWLLEITDPQERVPLEERLLAEETKEVKANVENDPQASIERILTGHNRHGSERLGVAVGHWLTIDSEAASQWIAANGSS
jgi:hypothetical protein